MTDWCERSAFGMYASEAKEVYGKRIGECVCPKCNRVIKLRQGNGVAWTMVPRHKKPA